MIWGVCLFFFWGGEGEGIGHLSDSFWSQRKQYSYNSLKTNSNWFSDCNLFNKYKLHARAVCCLVNKYLCFKMFKSEFSVLCTGADCSDFTIWISSDDQPFPTYPDYFHGLFCRFTTTHSGKNLLIMWQTVITFFFSSSCSRFIQKHTKVYGRFLLSFVWTDHFYCKWNFLLKYSLVMTSWLYVIIELIM